MIIAIRTDSAAAELVLLEAKGHRLEHEHWEPGRQLSIQLLERLTELLRRHHQSWKTLTGVIVFRGPGSFTGLRIGVTVANTLAYAQNIPIVGVCGDDWIEVGYRRLQAGETDKQVLPAYGAGATITRPDGSKTSHS